MSVLGKLKFWKREDAELSDIPGQDEPAVPEMPRTLEPPADFSVPPAQQGFGQSGSAGSFPRASPGFAERASFNDAQSFAPQSFGQQGSLSADQQMQLINSKLDTIKAQLEVVLQRLDNLERRSVPEERPYQQRWKTSM